MYIMIIMEGIIYLYCKQAGGFDINFKYKCILIYIIQGLLYNVIYLSSIEYKHCYTWIYIIWCWKGINGGKWTLSCTHEVRYLRRKLLSTKFVIIIYYILLGLASVQYLVLIGVINMLLKIICGTWCLSASVCNTVTTYEKNSTSMLS